jgi:hypothetical protein
LKLLFLILARSRIWLSRFMLPTEGLSLVAGFHDLDWLSRWLQFPLLSRWNVFPFLSANTLFVSRLGLGWTVGFVDGSRLLFSGNLLLSPGLGLLFPVGGRRLLFEGPGTGFTVGAGRAAYVVARSR